MRPYCYAKSMHEQYTNLLETAIGNGGDGDRWREPIEQA